MDKTERVKRAVEELQDAINDLEADNDFVVRWIELEREDTFSGETRVAWIGLKTESKTRYLFNRENDKFLTMI